MDERKRYKNIKGERILTSLPLKLTGKPRHFRARNCMDWHPSLEERYFLKLCLI